MSAVREREKTPHGRRLRTEALLWPGGKAALSQRWAEHDNLGSDRGVGHDPDSCACAGHAKNDHRNEQSKNQAREWSAIGQIALTFGYGPPRDVDHQDDGRDETQDRKNNASLHGTMIPSRSPIGKGFRARGRLGSPGGKISG